MEVEEMEVEAWRCRGVLPESVADALFAQVQRAGGGEAWDGGQVAVVSGKGDGRGDGWRWWWVGMAVGARLLVLRVANEAGCGRVGAVRSVPLRIEWVGEASLPRSVSGWSRARLAMEVVGDRVVARLGGGGAHDDGEGCTGRPGASRVQEMGLQGLLEEAGMGGVLGICGVPSTSLWVVVMASAAGVAVVDVAAQTAALAQARTSVVPQRVRHLLGSTWQRVRSGWARQRLSEQQMHLRKRRGRHAAAAGKVACAFQRRVSGVEMDRYEESPLRGCLRRRRGGGGGVGHSPRWRARYCRLLRHHRRSGLCSSGAWRALGEAAADGGASVGRAVRGAGERRRRRGAPGGGGVRGCAGQYVCAPGMGIARALSLRIR
eukprot:ctg_1670.g469